MMKIKLWSSLICLYTITAFAEPIETELEAINIVDKHLDTPSFNTEAISKDEFQQQELIERGITNLDTMTRQIANLHFTSYGIGSYGQKFALRGIVNASLFSVPAVVVYVDDVPYSNSLATVGQLFAVEHVDIYRSPQSGKFGKNAYAGAINIKTLQPTNSLHSGISLELANYDSYQVTANASGALIKDELYFNLNGQYQQRDGFLYNSYLNYRPDQQYLFSGRAGLKWTPNKTWDIRFDLTKEHLNYGAARYIRLDSPDFYTVQSETHERLLQHDDSEAIRIAYHGDDYELLSVSSRRLWHTGPRVTDLNLIPTLFSRIQTISETAWTQEFRLSPKTLQGNWNWQAGLFYSNIDRHGATDTLFMRTNTHIGLNKNHTDNYALFGQLAYQKYKWIKPHLDMRLDYVNASVLGVNTYANGRTLELKQRDNSLFASPKLAIDITLDDNALLYASIGLGFKPAGFTVTNINSHLSHYQQERLWHNELGIKSQWFNNRFKLNVAGFYYDINNYQIERFFTQTDYTIVNAPKAHSYGFELESQTELLNNLTLDANLGYTHAQFDRYIDPITNVNYTGKMVPFIPDFTGLLALQYKHPQGYFARLEQLWTGRVYFDELNTDIMQQKNYAVTNLRLGYEQKNYSVYLFANNLTDRHYYNFKIDNLRGVPSDPRLFGARLSVSF